MFRHNLADDEEAGQRAASRCQVHKIRNVVDHLTQEYQSAIRWNRIHGHRELPILVEELELAVARAIPLRRAIVA